MAFAIAWLDKRAIFPELFSEAPDNQTGIIIVIPAFDEPGISSLLDSLASCDEPDCKSEVIIIVNAHSTASEKSIQNNTLCLDNIKKWKTENLNPFFRLYVYDAGSPMISGWGVGLARKTGMDEALRRFNAVGKPEGVIVSLDADCTVEKNYFTAICNNLYKVRERKACSISFEHPLSGDEFPDNVYKYVTAYELHMRYFYQAVKYSGYPYTFHTIGSAIAFRASAYVKAGGMNRKQAGEDFYFIQKLIPQGGYFNLDSTKVYPSPRTSARVPFGTGSVISRLLSTSDGELLTYSPVAFRELHLMFCQVKALFRSDGEALIMFYNNLPPGLKSFIDQDEWVSKITEIKSNTSTEDSFIKRFFGWFNMFRIVKYLNHVHSVMFEKIPVTVAANEMLSDSGTLVKSKEPFDLLNSYRLMEKESNG